MNTIKPRKLVKKGKKFKLDDLNSFVGINKKGVYYIENNLLNNKFSRYFMFLRMKGADINKIVDHLIEHETQLNNKKDE